MENKTTNRAKMSNKRCIKVRLQYLQRGYKASEATSLATCFALLVFTFNSGFPGWLTWFSLQIFCLNNTIHFSLANNSAGFKRRWFKMTVFAHSQTTNKLSLWMKLPTIPPGLADTIVKYRPLSEPIRLQDLEDSEYNSLGHCQTGHEVVSLLEMKEVTGCKLYNNNNNNNNNNYIAHFL